MKKERKMRFKPDYSSRFRILKGGKISLVVSALLGSVTLSFAAPSGGIVTSGSATINQSGKVTNINQSTQKASINWQKFNVAIDETVNFNQPNVNSITLNRVVGNERSVINGALNANGQVWILNSNGVLFGKNASINTAGLLATTKELSDQDFQAGNYTFKGNSTASVINLGEIDISESGYATLLANSVSNEGVIKAVKGKVHLVGANEVTINLNGNSIVDLTVNKGVLDALVENKGAVYADGGEIYITTNAVDELLKGVVNNEGVIEANSFESVTGYVELFAHGGEAKIGGTITAKDGFVETSGKEFTFNDAKIQAGEWLIDPVNVTIDDSLANAIETQLNNNGDVIIETDQSDYSDVDTSSSGTDSESGTEGNIYVNSEITWSTAQKLTLDAYNDIFINKSITATNAAGQVALYYGQGAVENANTADYYVKAPINLKAGDNFFTKLGNDGAETTWTVVTTATALESIALDGNSVLGADVDTSSIANWTPIGNLATKFTGNFDGLGHTISNLKINNASNLTGLFGITDGATIKNIGVVDADIQSYYQAGILIGYAKNTTIENSYTTGKITGTYESIGGLVGYFTSEGGNNHIENSYSSADVTGTDNVGGLVGQLSANAMNGGATASISNAYATGNVTGTNNVGGLVGELSAYSMEGDATASISISNAYATGNVTGTDRVGGLVGQLSAYSMDGDATASISISNAYATGNVSGTGSLGGLVANIDGGTIENSWYDKETNTGTMNDNEFYGKTTDALKNLALDNWDIETYTATENTYPTLAWQDSGNSYTKVWVIGTKVASTGGGTTGGGTTGGGTTGGGTTGGGTTPTPTPTPSPTPSPEPTPELPVVEEQQKEVNKIITTIVNQESVTVTVPKVQTTTTTPNNVGQNVAVNFNAGGNQMLISQPIEGQPTQRITLGQARQMQLENGVSGEEVRVPLSRSSMIELVNGGVLLPDGVEQEFYVAEDL